ncbi:SpaH/EbpB family LPXTG-anchored major pilin [Gardnerella leopoldii]|uniref:SpaH/EbpB family LPXTG-anchored major pilin n=1 Tax=Gardnerella TaxID=2701 RepID=UPI0039F093B8
MNKFTKQCVAAFASLAMAGTLCVAGAVVANNVAFATGADQTAAKPAPWSDAGKKLKGKITINKWKYEGENIKNTPVNGAKFKVTKVTKIGANNVDVTTYAGWEDIAKQVTKLNTNDESGVTLATNGTEKEIKNGKAEFTDLDLGLYKVEESFVPNGYSSDVKPFYMTVPQIDKVNGGGAKFVYEVSANPKNKDVSGNITKAVDDTKKFVGAGDTIAYTISAAVNKSKPTSGNLKETDIQGYTVFDDAPTDAFETIDESVVKTVKFGSSNLSKTTDYTVEKTTDKTQAKKLADGYTRISVKFTSEGLKKIVGVLNTDADPSKPSKVVVSLEFKIKDNRDKNNNQKKDVTSVVNKSGFTNGHGDNENPGDPVVPGEGTPGSVAKTEFGYLQVNKVNASDNAKKLANAEFKLFAEQDKANACAKGLAEGKAIANVTECASASTFNGKTNKNGEFDTSYKAKAGTAIYLVETKAPEGYALSDTPKAITITANQTHTETFENVPTSDHDWFNLPKTGAAGVIIFALAGMCLVAVGMFIFLRNRKKDEEQQAA